MEYYLCAKITNTHALKGMLKIKNLSDFNRFEKGNTLYIDYNNEYVKVIVSKVSYMNNFLLVSFKDLEDINLVLKYKNCNIYVSSEDIEQLEEDEFYYHQLIGKKLINQNNELRGVVDSIMEVPQGHLLVVVVKGKNKFIPFRNEFITKVLEEEIHFIEIEGLL